MSHRISCVDICSLQDRGIHNSNNVNLNIIIVIFLFGYVGSVIIYV